MDHTCPACGSWMETTIRTSPRGARVATYSCNECGLYYSADG